MNAPLIGIEIGGTKLQVVTGTPNGQITTRHRFNVDPARGGAGIRDQLANLLPQLTRELQPVAVAAGFGGPVDHTSGRICCSHQVAGWSEFPLGEWLHSLTGLPATVENDANTAALGEAIQGAGQGCDPVFYVTLGSGVGGGCVVQGRVYHGQLPGEAEIGHLRLDRSGVIVEQRCSGWAVDRRVRELARQRPAGVLGRLALEQPGGEARHLAAALAAGDPDAALVVDETAGHLAYALSHVVHLFHPAVIVLGGGLALLGAPLQESVAKQLPGFLMEAFRPGPGVLLAALREDAVPVGALLLAGRAVGRREESR